jgi:hypothetical protein
MPTSMLASGFEAAWIRFAEACKAPSPEDALHSLFEVVAWAGALRDRFKKEGRDIYPELEGLWLVRNVTLHMGADALEWAVFVPGAELGNLVLDVSRLDTQTVWRADWRALSKLPRGRNPKHAREGEPEYDKHLAGQDVAETLQVGWLEPAAVDTSEAAPIRGWRARVVAQRQMDRVQTLERDAGAARHESDLRARGGNRRRAPGDTLETGCG